MPAGEYQRDSNLVERFRSGDREAFACVYRAHSPAVYRFALHMLADAHKADEVTQQVFVWLIHHAGAFDPSRGELGPFLIGVTRKMLQRHWNGERRWVPLEAVPEPGTGYAAGPEPDVSDAVRLRAAIAALPERYREAVVLCDLQEQSYEGAAAALGCAVGTVRSRLHRARGLLMRKLRGAGVPPSGGVEEVEERERERCPA